MADTSRKRSRKSKLVPREYPVDEDDIELQLPVAKISKDMKRKVNKVIKQEPPESSALKPDPDPLVPEEVCDTSVLRKINASTRESTETEETLPRRFEVNIEVESCDGHNYFGQELLSPLTGNEISVVKRYANPTAIPLTLEFIHDANDNLYASTNVADKILSLYLRNTIGYDQKQKVTLNSNEIKIQAALDEWRIWQSRSFYREDPLFYKCYVCTRSYWHLSEFRNHLASNHPDDALLIVSLEKYESHEANIIAYHTRLVVIKDIYTPGLCYRCGRDFGAHEISSRVLNHFYRQEGCPLRFPCCTGLRDHFRSCTICNVQGKPFKCDICKSRFDTNDELVDHLILSHSARSDLPIMSRYSNCKVCSERFYCKYLHNCTGKRLGPNFECPHCFISFSNALMLQSHMKTESITYICEVCGDVLPYNCMKFDHMLLHTDNYMIVKKCLICDGLNVFVCNEDAKAHWIMKHKVMDCRRQRVSRQMFVPSSCIYQRLTEIDLKEQESLLEAQESVSELQEEMHSRPEESQSGPEESQSGPEESQSGPEDEESGPEDENLLLEEQGTDVDEKESLLDIEENSVSAILQEKLYSARTFAMENVVVKKEPEDLVSPRLLIKEEPFEEVDYENFEQANQTDICENQIMIKQETIAEEESDEYDADIIKLNFNTEDLLAKGKTTELDDEITNESQDSDLDTEESASQTEDSNHESEIITRAHSKNTRVYRCSPCGFQGKHRDYKDHVLYNCIRNAPKHRIYNCTKCHTEFASMKKYLTHFEKHGYNKMSCPECLKQFKNFTFLGRHVQTHVKQNYVRVKMITRAGDALPDFQCKKCYEKVATTEFFKHWETHIKSEPSQAVKVTSKPYRKRIHGQLHETIIKDCVAYLHKQPKECNHCHRVFKRVYECKRHIIEHLLSDAYNQKHIYKELRCQICDSGFPNSDKYKHHMRDHASLPVYKCELCDRSFADSSNFTKHKKVHNLRVLVCDLCGKKFQSKLSLEKHIKKHETSKPIICEICNKIFYFETMYKKHVKYFHDRTAIDFRCVVCGERFKTLKFKWDHMWEVHGERKYKADCPICKLSFRKYSDVRAHAKAVHMIDVSLLTVKKSTTVVLSKEHESIIVERLINSTVTKNPGGRASETLIVYDSE